MAAQYGNGSAMQYKEVLLSEGVTPGSGAYGVRVDGDCLFPFFAHGDLLLCDPDADIQANDFVCVWWKDGTTQPISKRLLMAPPPKRFLGLGGDAVFLLFLEQMNPPRTYQVEASRVSAVHKIIGKADLV